VFFFFFFFFKIFFSFYQNLNKIVILSEGVLTPSVKGVPFILIKFLNLFRDRD